MLTTIPSPKHDLAVVIPSMNDGQWLAALFPTLVQALDGVDAQVIVADIESTDDTAAVVETVPGALRIAISNRGFAYANNIAATLCDARYVLFLNADTEILEGRFVDILRWMDGHPTVGLLGVRQVNAAGELDPTIRRAPGIRRALAEALFSERWGDRGERVLDAAAYARETPCAWTLGSFMFVRTTALTSTGWLDERFFFTAEERDFCARMRGAGWQIMHVPLMTIRHHIGKRGPSPRFAAQLVYAELQYAEKHFNSPRQAAYRATIVLNYALRWLLHAATGKRGAPARKASAAALEVAVGRHRGAPFMEPPPTAMPGLDRAAGR